MLKKTLAVAIAATTLAASAQTVNDPALVVESIADNLDLPTNMAFIGPNDILVNQKRDGRVRRVINGVVQPGEVLDLPVDENSERGLLGMALHPDFETNGYVYLYYTAAPSDGNDNGTANQVSRFTWNGSALTNETPILTLPLTPGPNHDGGIILFGPPTAAPEDQKLFVILGDLRRNGQTQNQSGGPPPDFTGSITRINNDGSSPTGIDKGPFADVAGANVALQTMYAYGIRNSYGMDFDPLTGALWDTENGPNVDDEVNRVDPAFNSGWNRIMGPIADENNPPSTLVQFSGVGTYSNPEFTWAEVVAPTAIHFYRGDTLNSQYANDAFVGCNNNGKLYHFEMSANPAERTGFMLTGSLADEVLDSGDSDAPIVFGQGFGAVTDIRTGPDGHLYLLSISHGNIYRIRPAETQVDNWSLYD